MAENRGRERAVVVGAGIAGLLAARALSPHYGRVTVIERDTLPEGPASRKGVPQGDHLHLLLLRGAEAMERLVPGLFEGVAGGGGVVADSTRDLAFFLAGAWLPRKTANLPARLQSRALLEWHLRKRILGRDNVDVIQKARVEGLLPGREGQDVIGVRVSKRGQEPQDLPSDLVVDASGRGSMIVTWLQAIGFSTPKVSRIEMNLAYASRVLRLVTSPGHAAMLVYPDPPHQRRGGALYQQEDGRWIVTLAGYGGEIPPRDELGFLEYADSLATRELSKQLRTMEPLTEIRTFRTPTAEWRHFERMRRFPSGLVIMGDAMCRFNPIFGQGMSTAALHAEWLMECLDRGGPLAIEREFRSGAARLARTPWRVSTTLDLAFPSTIGHRPLGLALLHWYQKRLFRLFAKDHDAYIRFMEVLHLISPPSCLAVPRVLGRMIRI